MKFTEEMTIPVCSTTHVSKETAGLLNALAGTQDTPVGVVALAAYQHGWFICFQSEDEDLEAMRPDLAALRRLTVQNGFTWVRLDSDADTVELDIYEW